MFHSAESDEIHLLRRGRRQDVFRASCQRQCAGRLAHIGGGGELVESLLGSVDVGLAVGECLLAFGGSAVRPGERLAGTGNLDQGPIDALLLVLDVSADIGNMLVGFGNGSGQNRKRVAITTFVPGHCGARRANDQHRSKQPSGEK